MRSIFICSLFIATTWSSWSQIVIDKVAAQVGDKVILLSDIQGQKLQAIQANFEMGPNMDCQILEELMYQNLLLNQANLDSIVIPEAQVDSEMEQRIRVIEAQIGGRQRLEEFYGKTISQIKSEFSSAIRDQMLSQEMERTITENVSVTPREVERFYSNIPLDSLPLINQQLSFQQIVIYPEITENDKKRAFQELQDIRKAIVTDGKSFATQARIHSQDPGSAAEGGRIEGTRGMMVPQFEATAYSLQVGDVSEIFETSFGYHIMKLLERKGDDYVCQHILIIPEFEPSEIETAAMRIDSCYEALKAGTITWDEAVLKYSTDEATRLNKGTITNPYTGEIMWDMEHLSEIDREIYILTDILEPGQFSQPSLYINQMERKQGVRIVKLVERKEAHRANMLDDYSLIMRAAEADKKQKVINEWTRAKIGNAYIRIDEEFQSCEFENPWIEQL